MLEEVKDKAVAKIRKAKVRWYDRVIRRNESKCGHEVKKSENKMEEIAKTARKARLR